MKYEYIVFFANGWIVKQDTFVVQFTEYVILGNQEYLAIYLLL